MHHGSTFYYLNIIILKITHIVKRGSHDRRESKDINNEENSNLVKRDELQHIVSL